jgi:hypothetical protein
MDTSIARNTSLDSMNLMGTILSAIAYGALSPTINVGWTINVIFVGVVFVICTLVIFAGSSGYLPTLAWRTVITFWLLLLATASTALQIEWTLLAFINQRQNISPSAFIEENVNNRIYVMLNVL